MKDTLFNSSRFALVARKYFFESKHTMLLRLVTMFGIMVIVFSLLGLFDTADRYHQMKEAQSEMAIQHPQNQKYDCLLNGRTNNQNSNEIIFAWFLLFFVGTYMGSKMVEHTGSKAGRISIYSQPATNFEKYFIRWLMVVPISLIIYALLFVGADLVRTGLCQMIYPGVPGTHHVYYDILWEDFFIKDKIGQVYVPVYLALQSIFMLGSTVFCKNKFIKTATATVLLILMMTLIIFMIGETSATTNNNIYYVSYSTYNNLTHIITSALLVLTVINWIVAYVRFKESDVIHRLL